ncbi:MAG: hypothetical protein IJE49_12700 [Agathobacter sp.]|nr:hypothetical protein [Agathobacter sp.]MBQ2902685.1 hypothetical protein [Agathobacter sp.]
MKTKLRRISFVMIMVLLFATIPLYNGERNTLYFAAENQEDNIPEGMKSDAEMIALALEYFPEYSEKINAPLESNILNSRTVANEDVLVINETKNISDVEQIVYQEYASGKSSILYIVEEEEVLTQNGSGRQMYKCINIAVYSRFLLGSIYIMGFAFTIYYDQYDRINDFGDFTASNLPLTIERQKVNEDAYSPASAFYTATFEYPEFSIIGSGVQRCALEIIVGDNDYSIEVY